MRAKLVPQPFDFVGYNGKRFRGLNMVMIVVDGCPSCLIHIDDFLPSGDLALRLERGETLEVEITVEEV